jgi:hypothetical protein
MTTKALLSAMILVLIVLWQVAGVNAASNKKVEADGILTSVENDGTIIISEKGYAVDPSVRVYSADKKRTTLDSLSLPAKVHYEFIYHTDGPIIILIREMGQ